MNRFRATSRTVASHLTFTRRYRVAKQVYVGGERERGSAAWLAARHVTQIIRVDTSRRSPAVSDSAAKIAAAVDRGDTVLVCGSEAGAAVAHVVHYLMGRHGWDTAKSLAYIREAFSGASLPDGCDQALVPQN